MTSDRAHGGKVCPQIQGIIFDDFLGNYYSEAVSTTKGKVTLAELQDVKGVLRQGRPCHSTRSFAARSQRIYLTTL